MWYFVQEILLGFFSLSYTARTIDNDPIMGYWKCHTKIYWDKINGKGFVEERKLQNVWREYDSFNYKSHNSKQCRRLNIFALTYSISIK